MILSKQKLAAVAIASASMSVFNSTMAEPNPSSSDVSSQPNVIIIFTDDQGWGDVGYHGFADIKTPNIDKLAEGGVHFPQAYVSASVCMPSRSGMITGVYQQRFGVYGNFDQSEIPRSQPMIMEMMQDAGYETAVIGKWHFGVPSGKPNERGADYFYGFLGGSHDYFKSDADEGGKPWRSPIYRNDVAQPPIQKKGGYLTNLFTDEAVGFIEQTVEKKKPFFINLSHFAVHHPWQVPPEYVERVADLPAGPERKHFAGMTLALDDGIGDVVDALKEQGVYDNTLIFFMSDNGSPSGQGFAQPLKKKRGETTMSSPGPFNGFKGDTHEGGIRVPFIMHWPDVLPKGKKYNEVVSSLDIVPTIAGLVGITETEAVPFDGVDLLPYLTGKKTKSEKPHETLYFRRDNDYAIRDGDWKLTLNDDNGPQTIRLFNMVDDGSVPVSS